MDFTLADVGDPLPFTVEVTRHRLSGMQDKLDLLFHLLGILRSAFPAIEASRRFARAKHVVGKAGRELLGTGDDVERALMHTPGPPGGRWGRRPIEFALEGRSVASAVKATRECMSAVQAELDMLLVLLLVLGRTCKSVGRERLTRAKRSVARARRHLLDACAQVESVLAGEPDPDGGGELAREAS